MTIQETILEKEREFVSQFMDVSSLTPNQIDKIFLDLVKIEINKHERGNPYGTRI